MKLLTLMILSIILLGLKILGLIHLSILWCLSPLWLPLAFLAIIGMVLIPVGIILLMALFCIIFAITLPLVIYRTWRDTKHRHDFVSQPLGLDQCADNDCGALQESK